MIKSALVNFIVSVLLAIIFLLIVTKECKACEVITIVKDGKHVVCSICPGIVICN